MERKSLRYSPRLCLGAASVVLAPLIQIVPLFQLLDVETDMAKSIEGRNKGHDRRMELGKRRAVHASRGDDRTKDGDDEKPSRRRRGLRKRTNASERRTKRSCRKKR